MKQFWELLKSIVLGLLGLGAFVVLAFFAIATWGHEEVYYRCNGLLWHNEETKDATLYAMHDQYRWPITMWSENAGPFRVELPGGPSDLFLTKGSGEYGLVLNGFDGKYQGQFTYLSRGLDVRFRYSDAHFVGACELDPR